MRGFYCTKCGSPNHKAFDCALPDGTVWTPPPGELERFNAEQAEEEARRKAEEPPPEAKLDPPRWPGGPEICTKENLPAFKDAAALAAFTERNSGSVLKKWECLHCGCLHAEFKRHPPGGTTSGSERSCEPLPKRLFIRQDMKDTTARVEQAMFKRMAEGSGAMDLPDQPVSAPQGVTSAPKVPSPLPETTRRPAKPKTAPSGQASLF